MKTPSKRKQNGWTPERRVKQSAAIHRWKPWQQSTGAKTPEGKSIVSQNAFKGGMKVQLKEFRQILREQKELLEKLK